MSPAASRFGTSRGSPRKSRPGLHYLPGAPTGGRETLITSPIAARPQYVLQIPGPSWWPFLGAVFTAICFFMLTVKWMLPACVTGVAAAACIIRWMWDTEPLPKGRADIGGGLVLPTHMTGPQSHSWWATVILLLVCGTSFACLVFSYLFLWTTREDFFTAANLTLPHVRMAARLGSALCAFGGIARHSEAAAS